MYPLYVLNEAMKALLLQADSFLLVWSLSSVKNHSVFEENRRMPHQVSLHDPIVARFRFTEGLDEWKAF